MLPLNKDIKLSYSSKFINTINLLCVASYNLEWSGILFYKILSEENMNFEIELVDVFLMDIGTAGSTQYSFDGLALEYFVNNNYMDNGLNMGHIHSHNFMSVFFSNVDDSELADNANLHKLYLSVIVNNNLDLTFKATIQEFVDVEITRFGKLGYNSFEETRYIENRKEALTHVIIGTISNLKDILPVNTSNAIINRIYDIKKQRKETNFYNFNSNNSYKSTYKNKNKEIYDDIPTKSIQPYFPEFIDLYQDTSDIDVVREDIKESMIEVAEEFITAVLKTDKKYKNPIKTFILNLDNNDLTQKYIKILANRLKIVLFEKDITYDELINILEKLIDIKGTVIDNFISKLAKRIVW